MLDLAVGSRVACSRNIAAELGLYNEALGTVVGFGFQAKTPPPTSTLTLSEHVAAAAAGKESEIPVVFVQMNNLGDPNRGSVADELSCDPEGRRRRVVPFVAEPSRSLIKHRFNRCL
ncbi:hypothetical protein M885DRAFT_572475 [Pelagophyceae sp. CCMP2097]|nr:hypothetical protein M885DRAFT_572475 [Pelagophyceae sp. CCMP2097]